MKRSEAILYMLQIVATCNAQTRDGNGCTTCPFGNGPHCLASAGQDIPSDWRIEDLLDIKFGECHEEG